MEKEKNLLKDFATFDALMNQVKAHMEKMEAHYNRFEVSKVALSSGKVPAIRKTVNQLINFVEFPQETRQPGRPVKFLDSQEEKEAFINYRNEGLSTRKIAEVTGMSKDMVNMKLQRYGIS